MIGNCRFNPFISYTYVCSIRMVCADMYRRKNVSTDNFRTYVEQSDDIINWLCQPLEPTYVAAQFAVDSR